MKKNEPNKKNHKKYKKEHHLLLHISEKIPIFASETIIEKA